MAEFAATTATLDAVFAAFWGAIIAVAPDCRILDGLDSFINCSGSISKATSLLLITIRLSLLHI